MNPAALYLASGDSLYPGALLLGVAVLTAPPSGSRGLRSLHSLAAWLGFSLIVMAAPPVSGWMAAVFLAAFSLWFVAKGRIRGDLIWIRLRFTAATILMVWLLAVPSSELLRRRMPRIHGDASDHLVVIGDSISSGIDAHTPAWPTVLQRQTGVPVQNLSHAGAGMVEARAMASRVQPKDTLILIEIGGNDLLSGMSSAEFGQALELLISSLSTPGRTLVMFELPLLPHKIGFGQMQRRLSTKYGVFLIPKHSFTGVLGGTNATSDGLHLSESGARKMATLVAQVLSLQPVTPATL
jgi:acyl-CoA thioesterase I